MIKINTKHLIMLKSGHVLLNVRLCFYSVSFVHLVATAVVVLSIDPSNDDDPRVRAYTFIRWRLLTCWFNLITLAYFPLCLYCDWMEKLGRGDHARVATLRKVKDLVMTSILFPTTMYADVTFWRLWLKDPALIAPVRIFEYLPSWSHHSLHTLSMLVIVLDLLLVPRQRPASLLSSVITMTAFFTTYTFVLFWSYLNGQAVYAIFDIFDNYKLALLLIYAYIEYLFYFTMQWCIIDLVWGRQKPLKVTYAKDQ